MSRILLIDDDDLFRTMLRLTLVKLGHDVREARDGKAAVRLHEQEPSDLVITDLIMPEQEGLETIGELRRNYPGVKIIAMSGGGRTSPVNYLKVAGRLGAKATLAKPFSDQELTLAIDTALA